MRLASGSCCTHDEIMSRLCLVSSSSTCKSSNSNLSSVVANGHQPIHHVFPSPSKLPYGGFFPVRLQAGIQPQPSPIDEGLKPPVGIRRPTICLYATTVLSSRPYSPNRLRAAP